MNVVEVLFSHKNCGWPLNASFVCYYTRFYGNTALLLSCAFDPIHAIYFIDNLDELFHCRQNA